jgi:hypothetical protein
MNMVASKAGDEYSSQQSRDELQDVPNVPYGLESVIGIAYRDGMNRECTRQE